jgi:capsular polysaccharide biosynthesis protein
MRLKIWSPYAVRQDFMNYPVDGLIEGPGLLQSIWRYKWLVGALVLLGMLSAFLLSATQPTRYEADVRIFLSASDAAANHPDRTVMSHAQFIESPTVSDRVIALTGNRLTHKELQRRLTVEPSAEGDFITVRALDTTPRNAAGLADAVQLAYRQIVSEQRKAAANGTIAALEDAQRSLASELAQIKKKRRTGDSPALQAEEQAKRRQMEATASKIERISADGVPPPALQDKATVPDEPAQPKPLRAGAIGAVVGLVIGVALAWLLAARRRIRSGARTTASEIQESPGQARQLADVDHNRATESVGQAVDSLDKDPELLYSLAEWLESQHQNFPQITAERLRDRLLFEKVAVLLKSDEGLDLAGCVGWHPDGVRPVGQHDPTILNKLGANGARQIESAERDELLNAGLLENEDQTIVVAPLKHENVAFGVLLAGQEESFSKARRQSNGSFDGIGSFARSVAPDLHAWLLLHKLREQLASYGAQEQTTSPAESESVPPSAESVAPSAEFIPPSAESVAPSAESVAPSESMPPSAESMPPSPESVAPSESMPPSAESMPPSPESIPPSAESVAPSAESIPPSVEPEPRSAWPIYPVEPEPPSAPDSQPVSSVDQQDEHQVARS